MSLLDLVTPEKFSGCLVGQCLADALGSPVEGYPPETCQTYVDEILKKPEKNFFGRGKFPFGQYTDDSQLARELMQSYVDTNGQFSPANYAKRIAAIFQEQRIVGRGRATEEAAMRLAAGVDWQKAGTPAPAAGNGSAMRAAPVGLLFFDNPKEMIQVAHNQGIITHQNPLCSAGSVAIAGATALVLQSKTIDKEAFLIQLSSWVGEVESTFASAIMELKNWVLLPPNKAVTFISRAGLDTTYSDKWQGISPFVMGSVLWSLYSFLRTPEDYWETVCTSIAVGGDVDTTGAMAGAISGAYLGLSHIPVSLTDRLNDQGTWKLAQLVALANECYALKFRS